MFNPKKHNLSANLGLNSAAVKAFLALPPRRNAPLRAAVAAASASAARQRVPSPPKPKVRTPSPPKPKVRTPSPPKPTRFRSPNRAARAAYERLSPRSKRKTYLAPTRFIQNLMNEEARLMNRQRRKYSNNLNENRRLRNANLRRMREIMHIIGSISTRSRSPTGRRPNPFLKRSPRSTRQSRARGRSLSAVPEAL